MVPLHIVKKPEPKEMVCNEDKTPLPYHTPSIEPSYSGSSSAACGNQFLDLLEKHKKEIQSKMAINRKGIHEMLEKKSRSHLRDSSNPSKNEISESRQGQQALLEMYNDALVKDNYEERGAPHAAKVSIVPIMAPAAKQKNRSPAQKQETLPPVQKQETLPPVQKQETLPPVQKQETLPPVQKQETLPPVHNIHPQKKQRIPPQNVESDEYMEIPNNFNARNDYYHYDPLFNSAKPPDHFTPPPVPTAVANHLQQHNSSPKRNDLDDIVYEPDEASDLDDNCCNNNHMPSATRVSFKLPDATHVQQQGGSMGFGDHPEQEPFDIEANPQGVRSILRRANNQEYNQTQEQALHYRGAQGRTSNEPNYEISDSSSSDEEGIVLGGLPAGITIPDETTQGQGFWSFMENSASYVLVAFAIAILGFGFWVMYNKFNNGSGSGESSPQEIEYYGPVM